MARLYDSRKRILVTGGAGFLGSHLIDRLLAAGHEVLCVDNLFTGTKRNIEHLHGHAALRVHAPRRDLPALCRGGRDLQSRLPGLANPLPARSGADDQDIGARRDQHAGPGQAPEVQNPSGLDQRGLWRPISSPAAGDLLGQRQPDRTRAPATTRASAAPRRCSSTITASTAWRSRSRASSTPTGRACIPPTGASSPTSSCRRLSGEPITLYGDGEQTRSFCYVDDLVDGLRQADGHARRLHGSGQPRQPGRVHHQGAGRADRRATGSQSNWSTCHCRRTTRSSASPTSASRARSWGGNRVWHSTRAWGRPSIILRRGLGKTPCASLSAKPLRNNSSDWPAPSLRAGSAISWKSRRALSPVSCPQMFRAAWDWISVTSSVRSRSCSRSLRSASAYFWASTGARPWNGSSSKTRRVPTISARPSATILPCPPGECGAGAPSISFNCGTTSLGTAASRRRRPQRQARTSQAQEQVFPRTLSAGKITRSSGA